MSFVSYQHDERGIFGFVGDYYFLSNFHTEQGQKIPFEWVNAKGKLQKTICTDVETAFQASKTLNPEKIEWVLGSEFPGEAKIRGQQVPMREDWTYDVRVAIMQELAFQKFIGSPSLWMGLDGTGNLPLSEWNSWGDTFWGMVNQKGKWVGANWLGRIHMINRGRIRNLCDCCWKLPSIHYQTENVKVCKNCIDHHVDTHPCTGLDVIEHTQVEYQ